MPQGQSLFDPPPESVLTSAADWITSAVFGDLAVSLCVIAVAFVGLQLLSGRLAARDGLRVVICCFVLFGAPTIAAGLLATAEEASPGTEPKPVAIEAPTPQPSLPPANYDPYAGASLRRY